MFRSLVHNHRLQWAVLGLVTAFFALWFTTPPDVLMALLNGLFAGSVVAIATAYYRLIVAAIRGEGEYDRVRLMTVGIFLLWVSVVATVGLSIYARSTEFYTATYMWAAVSRYLAIIAAILQMRSLDYGWAMFNSRDKRLIWTGTVAGAIVAVVSIYCQLK